MIIIFKKLKNTQNSGFTLIELLLAIFIFSLVVLAVSGIYLSFNNSQSRSNSSQQLLNNSQYVLEIMSREIKQNAIARYNFDNPYECNTLINTNSTLTYDGCIILERANGQSFAFAKQTNSVSGNITTSLLYILLDCNDDYTWCDTGWRSDIANSVTLLSPRLNNTYITDLNFDITPTTDPFAINGPNQQPRVTIRLDTEYYKDRYVAGNQFENISQSLQTTVSSRVYKR